MNWIEIQTPWAQGAQARGRSAGQTNRHGESVGQEIHPCLSGDTSTTNLPGSVTAGSRLSS
jgi:hypothetical protein